MSCSLSVKNRVSFCFPNKLYTVPFPVNAHYPHFKQLRLCYVKMIHSFTKVNSLNIISMKFSTKRTTYYRLKNLNKFVEKNWKLLWFRVYRDNIWSKARMSQLPENTRHHDVTLSTESLWSSKYQTIFNNIWNNFQLIVSKRFKVYKSIKYIFKNVKF